MIFIASESGIMTPGDMIHHGMTKSAQLAISRGLAQQTKGTKVTVNTVLPGPTRSEGIVEFLKGLASNPDATAEEAEFFEKHRATSLLQGMIEPQEIASLVAYVASPLSAATNGAALRVDGGSCRPSHDRSLPDNTPIRLPSVVPVRLPSVQRNPEPPASFASRVR